MKDKFFRIAWAHNYRNGLVYRKGYSGELRHSLSRRQRWFERKTNQQDITCTFRRCSCIQMFPNLVANRAQNLFEPITGLFFATSKYISGGRLVSVERKLLLSLLKLTKSGPVKQENVKENSRLPTSVASTLLEKLQSENLAYLKNGLVEVDSESRLKLAVKAVGLGADVQCISDVLVWQEFEAMAALALELNGYTTQKNVRFKHKGKRWEIDVVACRKPLVICIDCKHWHSGMHPSTLARMAVFQGVRVKAFADSLPNVGAQFTCTKWERANFVPVIISLIPFSSKFLEGIPIVPVLQMQNFINQLPLNIESLWCFRRQFSHL